MLVKAIINSIPRIAKEAGCRCILSSHRQPGINNYCIEMEYLFTFEDYSITGNS